MLQALYTTKSGMQAQQKRVDVIANNIANINMTGYKSSNVCFKDMLYYDMLRPIGEQDDYNLKLGSGVLVNAISKDFSVGTAIGTGVNTDLMIDGEGFFSIEQPNGEIGYTRNGAFKVSTVDGQKFLVNGNGNYVLDENGDRIELVGDTDTISFNQAGEITVDGINMGTLGIYTFPNNGGLSAAGSGVYVETVASGAPVAVDEPNVLQGFLENSNVDLALEMTKLVRSQRSSSLSATAMTTVDEMLAMGNNLRK